MQKRTLSTIISDLLLEAKLSKAVHVHSPPPCRIISTHEFEHSVICRSDMSGQEVRVFQCDGDDAHDRGMSYDR